MKIAITGTGYVGLSNAVLLAQHHDVIALDVVADKIIKINQRQSPIADKELEDREFNFEVRHSPMPPDGTLRIP